ncbi:hypothetical protein IAT38_006232 [Cryptococcus sp. DSM 104549]
MVNITLSPSTYTVPELDGAASTDGKGKNGRKAHWANDKGTAFKNPWTSFKMPGFWPMARFAYEMTASDPAVKAAKTLIPHVTPTFGAGIPREQVKATWLGHACVLVEMPLVAGAVGAGEKAKERGVRVLFDPVLGQKMAYGMGPKRESTPVCKVEDVPEIDIIAISHNHYDHLDLPTLTSLLNHQRTAYSSEPALFLPLNNKHIITGLPIEKEKIVELDWWEGREVGVGGVGSVKVICTPCQHASARTPFDRDHSLWSSWVVQDLSTGADVKRPASVFFGGDTGYCTMHKDVHTGSHYPSAAHPVPVVQDVCPAFKEIGARLGPFSLGMIPIGAYAPRTVMSPVHAAPVDGVKIFQDTGCKKALGIHWGTFRMTNERFTEPPEKLVEAMEEAGLDKGLFGICALGESLGYDV